MWKESTPSDEAAREMEALCRKVEEQRREVDKLARWARELRERISGIGFSPHVLPGRRVDGKNANGTGVKGSARNGA